MDMSDFDSRYSTTGWRIEQKYRPGVLIGNWSEERHKWVKNGRDFRTTYFRDFKDSSNSRPDTIIRREGQVRNEGLGQKIMFSHHGNDLNMLTWYDENYNGRWRENPVFKGVRKWDQQTMGWAPERSDYPLQGKATNFGLYEWMQEQYGLRAKEVKGPTDSIYTSSFTPAPNSALVTSRYATPKLISSTTHKYNHNNKDLELRNQMPRQLAPERISPLTKISS